MGGARARVSWRRLRLHRADERRQPRGRRARAPGRSALGGDDPCHQGDAAQAHRSGEGPSLSDRMGRARRAACGLCLFGEAAPTHLSATSVGALIWQGVVVAGVSYALWFWTLTRCAVAQLSAFTFITPLVGVFAGWLVFGEALSWGFSVAIVLVIAGLALVNWPRRRRTQVVTT